MRLKRPVPSQVEIALCDALDDLVKRQGVQPTEGMTLATACGRFRVDSVDPQSGAVVAHPIDGQRIDDTEARYL